MYSQAVSRYHITMLTVVRSILVRSPKLITVYTWMGNLLGIQSSVEFWQHSGLSGGMLGLYSNNCRFTPAAQIPWIKTEYIACMYLF